MPGSLVAHPQSSVCQRSIYTDFVQRKALVAKVSIIHSQCDTTRDTSNDPQPCQQPKIDWLASAPDGATGRTARKQLTES